MLSVNFKPKTTAATSCGSLATAQLSCKLTSLSSLFVITLFISVVLPVGVLLNVHICCQLIAEHPVFEKNSALQQQLKHMMPQYIQQVCIVSLFKPKNNFVCSLIQMFLIVLIIVV